MQIWPTKSVRGFRVIARRAWIWLRDGVPAPRREQMAREIERDLDALNTEIERLKQDLRRGR
jgi:hypothetical protein